MLTPDEAAARAADAVARATRGGADAADAVCAFGASTDVTVRLGRVESIERSEGGELGVRVFVGRRSATSSTSDLSSAAIAALVERTLAMARLAPEDPFAALAPADALAHAPFPPLDSDDGGEVAPEALRDRARTAEDAARGVAGVTNSQGGSASAGRSITALATSTGFTAAAAGSSHGTSASVLAGEGAAMQRDYHYHSARHLADLEEAEEIGQQAGRRAVARLDPVRLPSGAMPVVLDPRVSPSLIGHLAGAISGAAIARGTSFLREHRGQRIMPAGVSVMDDPHRARGLRSRAWDGEGLPTARTLLVDDGVLVGWIADVAAAAQLGIAPTGHASRGVSGAPGVALSNAWLTAGRETPAALMADIADGFYVTELIGMGVNALTGDYSRGASGFRIRDGVLAEPIAEVTIAGNLLDMFAALRPADDLAFRHAVDAPTLRIDGMTIAGD